MAVEIDDHPLEELDGDTVGAPLPRHGEASAPAARLRVTLVSFGFKYGPPPANHAFDVSFLKNPARQEGWNLWSEPGAEMRDWVIRQPEARAFLGAALPLLRILPTVDDDARVAFGCSAGRHRSAILVEEIARHLRSEGIEVVVIHRERSSSTPTPR